MLPTYDVFKVNLFVIVLNCYISVVLYIKSNVERFQIF